jgi:diguanylate cyclase (GGDEF)-like protein
MAANLPPPAAASVVPVPVLLLGLALLAGDSRATTAGAVPFEARAAAVLALADRREFNRAHLALEHLLDDADRLGDAALRARAGVTAARLLNRVPQPDAALLEASRALATSTDPVLRCAATVEVLEARRQLAALPLAEADFAAAAPVCAAGDALDRDRLALLRAQWLLQQRRPAEALALLEAMRRRLDADTAPELMATVAAQAATALQRLARPAEARARALEALVLAPRLSSREPQLLANQALFQAARQQGDLRAALATLRALREDQIALAEELRARQRAYLSARGGLAERQAAFATLQKRQRELRLRAEAATASRQVLDRLLTLFGLLLVLALLAILHVRRRRERTLVLLQHDALTGLWTRKQFLDHAEARLAEAGRTGTPVAFVLFDLDRFKQINDRFGHAFGDRVLVAVAEALRGLESGGHRFGRLGGEEFALLLPGTRLEAALAVAEACRRAITGIAVEAPDGERVQPSAGFGVVDSTVAGHRLRHLLANADHALYRAKAAGRNRIAATPVARPGFGAPADAAGGAA